jgi:hypothetical protein
VTSIGKQAFYGCSGLTSASIGDGIKTIGSIAFASCAELTDVYCYAENVPTTNTDAFSDSYIEHATLHVPAASVNSYSSREPWSNFGTIVPIGSNYGLSIIAGNHGTVCYNNQSVSNGSASFYLDEGANAVLTVTPENGYKIATLTVNGTDALNQLSNSTLTISNVTANTTVSVTFGIAGETETVTIGAAGMATFCSSKDLNFSEVEGLKAYTGAAFNRNTGALTMLEVKDVPAGTGLIVVGNAGNYDVPVSSGSSCVYANLLKGVSTATNLQQTANGYTNYILGSGAQGTGFYIVSAGGGTLAAGKAYLQIPTAAANSRSAISMEFVEGTTDISEHKAELTTEGYYTLSGQRTTSQPQKPGIYVKNGRKVVVK